METEVVFLHEASLHVRKTTAIALYQLPMLTPGHLLLEKCDGERGLSPSTLLRCKVWGLFVQLPTDNLLTVGGWAGGLGFDGHKCFPP